MTKLQAWTLGLFIILSLVLSGAEGGDWSGSPDNWNNSPNNWENSPNNWDNSTNNWDNSANKWGNDRTVRDNAGDEIGYTVPKESGGVNLYNYRGDREGYTP